jgi:hypothetical protein
MNRQVNRFAAIDSNVLTYFLEAFQDGYDPGQDVSGLANERVAAVRCFFYGERPFWVGPTVKRECARIRNISWADLHLRIPLTLLQDMAPETPEKDLEARAIDLKVHHPSHDDCRVVAEAEAIGLSVLLTCDQDLIGRLGPRSRVSMLRPSQFWDSLGIRRGAQPLLRPRAEHPLATKTWWRL